MVATLVPAAELYTDQAMKFQGAVLLDSLLSGAQFGLERLGAQTDHGQLFRTCLQLGCLPYKQHSKGFCMNM
jgi:hypothetical protein